MLKKFDYEKMPVVEVVNEILVDASKRGASDIHFDPHEDKMIIRIRIDGSLIDYSEVPNSIKKNLITRIKIISGMNITESRLPQDGAIKANLKGITLDLRSSCLPTLNGEKIVIRILDYSMSSQGLESLGFTKENYEKVLKMINVPNGIILVTGATGSGKSTTVYSILQRLNKEETNIITVEDPIEMDIEGVNQVQTNSEIGLTFATALRSILRQDPNIIMVGEIRDTETAKIAVRASITGHLVLSTIHTNSSLNTIERLLDMDVERYLLASALTGIISQKLARRLCPHCKTLKKTNDYEKELFKKVIHKEVNEIYTAEGCEECRNGYKGRIAIHEVLLVNQNIKDAISSNLRKDKLRELVYRSDVITLLEDGLSKVVAGETTFEEILKLIELENDDKKAGQFDLKDALTFTNLSQQERDHEEHEHNHEEYNENVNRNESNLEEIKRRLEKDKFEREEYRKPIEREETKPIEKDDLELEELKRKLDNERKRNDEIEKSSNSYLEEYENLKKEIEAKKENNFDWLKDDKLFNDKHLNDKEDSEKKESDAISKILNDNSDDDDLMNMDF